MKAGAARRAAPRGKASGGHAAAILALIALVIFRIACARAQAGEVPTEKSIVINRGETYLITGADSASLPEVRTVRNPHALIVNQQADGSVLVLGADPGVQSVRVISQGHPETYTFTVRALSDPDHPLNPGAAPTAVSDPFDRGSGPVSPAQGAAQTFTTDPPAIETRDGEPSHHRPDNLPEDTVSLSFGTSRVFNFPGRIKRIAIADSEIADVQVMDPHQLMLIGHKPGFTTLAVWDDQGDYQDCQVRVEQGGRQQVMLDVMVAELDRTRMEAQGIDLSATLANHGVSLVGLPGSVASPYSPTSVLNGSGTNTTGGILPQAGSLIPLLLSSNLVYGLAAGSSSFQTQSFLNFLESNSLARVLAQPQLVASSGEEAKFLSGGEIPIIIAQALNTSIVFKQFGTSVIFVPTVIGKNEIELVVKPEVSKPDFTEGVQLLGFVVPAFITQRAETVVRMKDQQTLIIAGLILRDRSSAVDKVPYLGDIPFAGSLFRHTTYQDQKTELVMTVTPKIVSPIPDGGQVEYPASGPMTREELRTAPVNPPDASRPRF